MVDRVEVRDSKGQQMHQDKQSVQRLPGKSAQSTDYKSPVGAKLCKVRVGPFSSCIPLASCLEVCKTPATHFWRGLRQEVMNYPGRDMENPT